MLYGRTPARLADFREMPITSLVPQLAWALREPISA